MKDNLKNTAITLIYPDGFVEQIPVYVYVNHIEYFKEHIKNSERFRSIIPEIKLGHDSQTHYEISKILAQNNIVEVANENIYSIVTDPSFLEHYKPKLKFFLPEHFDTSLQIEETVKIMEEVPMNLDINRYDSTIENFKRLSETDAYTFIDEENENKRTL